MAAISRPPTAASAPRGSARARDGGARARGHDRALARPASRRRGRCRADHVAGSRSGEARDSAAAAVVLPMPISPTPSRPQPASTSSVAPSGAPTATRRARLVAGQRRLAAQVARARPHLGARRGTTGAWRRDALRSPATPTSTTVSSTPRDAPSTLTAAPPAMTVGDHRGGGQRRSVGADALDHHAVIGGEDRQRGRDRAVAPGSARARRRTRPPAPPGGPRLPGGLASRS